MNNSNQLGKGNGQISSTLRSTLSGRLKRPSKELSSLGTSSKKPFLKEYSIAMQQKLQHLKDKISEKKKQKTKQQSVQNKKTIDQKLYKFLRTKSKPEQKNLQQTIQAQITKQKLLNFLTQNNLFTYQTILFQNQIDSLQILADATQKELQEIGIPKGHALKLKINVNKWSQDQFPLEKDKSLRQTKTKDSQRNISFVSVDNKNLQQKNKENPQQQIDKKVESICIGTEDDGIESITFVPTNNIVTIPRSNSKFCLFCYQSIKIHDLRDIQEFCTQDCSDRYNQMFKKYQNNLVKAQEEFKSKDTSNFSKKKQEQDEEDQQNEVDENQFDFLQEDDNYEDFDYKNYEKLRKQLGSD